MDLNKSIVACAQWLATSGIQEKSRADTKGGVYSWYDTQSHSYPFVYSEITGYAMSTFLFLKKFGLLRNAESAAGWLTNASANDAYQCKYYTESQKFLPHLCSFDAGMILAGLVSLYSETKMEGYKSKAVSLGNWMLTMQKSEGSFYPKWDLLKNDYIDNGHTWSTQSGTFHAKHVIGLLKLFGITNDKRYRDAAVKLCDWTVEQQKDDGRFVTNVTDRSTNLHPHAYTCEGLLYAGKKLNEEYAQAAIKGVEWALSQQLQTGGFPSIVKTEPIVHERMDINAQMIRLGCLASRDSGLNKTVARLLEFQVESGDQSGGFLYGHLEDGRKAVHVNSWVSMFAVQALMYYQARQEGIPLSMELFI